MTISPGHYTAASVAGGRFSTFDPAAGFPRIAVPDSIAHGVFDFSVPPTVCAGALTALSDVTYHAFERSGHYPQPEGRVEFGAASAS